MGFRGWSLARREEGARRATQACVLPLQKRPSPQPSPARGRGGMKRGAGHTRRRDVEGRLGEAKRVERRSGWRGEAGGEAKRVERRSGWRGGAGGEAKRVERRSGGGGEAGGEAKRVERRSGWRGEGGGEAERVERRSGWSGEAGGEAERVEWRSGWRGAWIRTIRHRLYSLLPRAGEGARRADEGAFASQRPFESGDASITAEPQDPAR